MGELDDGLSSSILLGDRQPRVPAVAKLSDKMPKGRFWTGGLVDLWTCGLVDLWTLDTDFCKKLFSYLQGYSVGDLSQSTDAKVHGFSCFEFGLS